MRLKLDQIASEIEITSRVEDGAWDTHAVMELQLQPRSVALARLDSADVRTRCPEHVTGEEFYASTGNDYRGEFRAMFAFHACA